MAIPLRIFANWDIEESEMTWNVIMTLMLMTSVYHVFAANFILSQRSSTGTMAVQDRQQVLNIAENMLNRKFSADAPNEKWLTDVTEFHYCVGIVKQKVYLSAILDLYDRRIVSYVIRDRNNNALVFDTVDEATRLNPKAHPLLHSDRGFQYTNRAFHSKLAVAGITQSMSRVAKCIDNGPMEGFWGILKRERYYGKRFTDKEALVKMIEDYIDYYNNKRLQRDLEVLTPVEKHEIYLQDA